MSKIVKTFKKAAKIGLGFLNKVKDKLDGGFMKVYNNPIGRVVITVAAIYLGGWALGAWGGPSTWFASGVAPAATTAAGGAAPTIAPVVTYSVNGVQYANTVGGIAQAVGSGTVAQAVAASKAAGAANAASGASTVNGVPVVESAGTPGPAAGSPVAPAGGGGTVNAVQPTSNNAVNSIAQRVRDASKAAFQFTKENQLLTSTGLMMAGQLLQPSADELQQKAQERYWNNLQGVGDINLGISPGGERRKLLTLEGQPVFDANGSIAAKLARTPGGTG